MKSKRIMFLCTLSISAMLFCSCSSGTVKRAELPTKNRPVIIINDLKNSSGELTYDSVISKASPVFNTAIAETNCFRIIERKRLSDLLKELELSMTGLIDPSKMKKVGKMLGADAILFIEVGKVTAGSEYTNAPIGKGRTESVRTTLSARLVNVETSEVIVTTGHEYYYSNTSYSINLELKIGSKIEKEELLYKLLGENAENFAGLIADKTIDQNFVSKQK